MNRNAKLNILEDWAKTCQEVEKTIGNLLDPIRIDPSSPLLMSYWKILSAYTDAVAMLVGDGFEWLHWYGSENKYGKHAKEAGFKDNTRKIRNVDDLVWLIENGKE